MGAVNGMRPDGTVDGSSEQSAEVWVGTTYALAAFMIGRGLVEEGWETARGVAAGHLRARPVVPDARGVRRATATSAPSIYLRPLAIWAIEEALRRSATAPRRLGARGALHEPADPDAGPPRAARTRSRSTSARGRRPTARRRSPGRPRRAPPSAGPRANARRQAGRGDPREGVERAERLERLEAEGVEPVDDQPAAAVVLGDASARRRARPRPRATSAASWAVVGADMIPYWWTLTMPSRIAAGAAR